MKYEIKQLTDDAALSVIFELLDQTKSKETLSSEFEKLQNQFPSKDHTDPLWLMYVYVGEYVDGSISKGEALNEVIEIAREHHLLFN